MMYVTPQPCTNFISFAGSKLMGHPNHFLEYCSQERVSPNLPGQENFNFFLIKIYISCLSSKKKKKEKKNIKLTFLVLPSCDYKYAADSITLQHTKIIIPSVTLQLITIHQWLQFLYQCVIPIVPYQRKESSSLMQPNPQNLLISL